MNNVKKASPGMAVPNAMHSKTSHLNCSRNFEKRKEYYFRKYKFLVLLFLLVNHIGFWLGYLFAIFLL